MSRGLGLIVAAAVLAVAAGARAQDMGGMEDMPGMDHHAMPGHAETPPQTDPPPAGDGDMSGMNMSGMDMSGHHDMPDHGSMMMTGALGPYSMNREASGTSWQPDASPQMGRMTMRGPWMFMTHGVINAVQDWQEGPRGGRMGFVSGMVMGMAQRSLPGGDALQFRAMLSPDPPMGPRGYPLLLASGETADGVTHLVDRQHPHDFFMELSASYSHRIGEGSSLFVYAGLPGEPAFGPPAFMHRQSIQDSPEAPIAHHWLDSTHVTFGVVTAGVVAGPVKLEVSRFHGREPDQHRWDIETGALDSTAARISWNPGANLSLQASWARVRSPEQLEPDADQTRWSASAIYTRQFGDGGWWSTTAAWGRRTSEGVSLDAFILEGAVQPWRNWTLFGRAERTDNNELTTVGGHAGPVYTVAKVSAGVIRDFAVSDHVLVGVGALYSRNFAPDALSAAYGGAPSGAMAFLRLKLR